MSLRGGFSFLYSLNVSLSLFYFDFPVSEHLLQLPLEVKDRCPLFRGPCMLSLYPIRASYPPLSLLIFLRFIHKE